MMMLLVIVLLMLLRLCLGSVCCRARSGNSRRAVRLRARCRRCAWSRDAGSSRYIDRSNWFHSCTRAHSRSVVFKLKLVVIAIVLVWYSVNISRRLMIAATHAHIASNTHAAALLCHDAAKRGALGQPRELLGAEDSERLRFHLESPVNKRCGLVRTGSARTIPAKARELGRVGVHVIGIFRLLIQVEAETIFPLMAHGQIGEQKVAGRDRSVKVGHAGDEHARQHRKGGRRLRNTALGNWARRLESSEEEEVGLV